MTDGINDFVPCVVDIFDYISIISYTHDKEITDYLSSLVNIRVIWGGDNTINEIRKSPVRPRCTEVCFADRYSLLLIDAAYINAMSNSKEIEEVAHSFFNDTYLYDQNACGSPRLIYWVGDSDSIFKAKKIFWEAVRVYVKTRYEVQPVVAVDKLTMSYKAAIDLKGSKIVSKNDGLITRIDITACNDIFALEEVTQGASYTEYRAPGGFYLEYSSDNMDALKSFDSEKLQTLTYICDKSSDESINAQSINAQSIKSFILKNGMKGIDRVVPVGHSADFSFIWDGYNLIEEFTRVISG